MQTPVYQKLASLIQARINCAASGNLEWFERHTEKAEEIIRAHLPHGSGFDAGVKVEWDKCNPDKIVLSTGFHHMNDGGYYDGWTEHEIIVRASLAFGFTLKVTGRDRRNIKEYIADTFHHCLSVEIGD